MNDAKLPLLADPGVVADHVGDADLLIVDLSPAELFLEHHAPGAIHLPYSALIVNDPPVGGLVPEHPVLAALFTRLGIGPETHVAAMDAEGGGAAGRLLWTLELLGHDRVSIVDGGLRAWLGEGLPTAAGTSIEPEPVTFRAAPDERVLADTDYILEGLGRRDLALLDARSADEYSGSSVRAARGGHIPGAVHFEWTHGMDRDDNLRMQPRALLREQLDDLGLTPDREIVTYCHTHHRSAFSYAMLRVLGYPRVRGYPGSWSAWGNRADTPVQTGGA